MEANRVATPKNAVLRKVTKLSVAEITGAILQLGKVSSRSEFAGLSA